MLNKENKVSNSKIHSFSPEEEGLINESLTQMNEGKVISHADLVKLSEQWIKEDDCKGTKYLSALFIHAKYIYYAYITN